MNNPHNFDKHYLLLPSNVTLYPTEGRTKKKKNQVALEYQECTKFQHQYHSFWWYGNTMISTNFNIIFNYVIN